MLSKIILFSLVLFLLTWGNRPSVQENRRKYTPGQLLVKFKPQISKEEVDIINEKFGCKIMKYLSARSLYLIKIPEGTSVEEMINNYLQIPGVEYAEPNYLISLP